MQEKIIIKIPRQENILFWQLKKKLKSKDGRTKNKTRKD